MKWFTGDVGMAIQKAIQEKKVFIVFVKDDKDGSKEMEELWNDDQIADVCNDEKCVAINILADSLPGQQFGAIYPVLCVPSTYLINNQGTPTDIIPGVLGKEEFIKRLQHAIENTLPPSTELQQTPQDTSTIEPSVDNDNQTATTSSSDIVETQKPNAAASADVLTGSEKVEARDEEIFNDDMESELTTEEESVIKMLREKLKTRREEEEKQKLKEMERKRRETGQDLQLAQRQIAEQQAVSLAKEIADRKSEEKAAREKVREQIKQDRLDKTKRFEQERRERDEARMKTEASAVQTAKKKADSSNTARLQFRLPDGSSISNQFNAEAKFLVAETFIKDHTQSQNVRLTTVYPKHEFNSEDMVKSFRELGLLPNASIIVSLGRSTCTSSSSSVSPMSFLMFVLSPIIALMNWIASLFTGGSRVDNQSAQTTTTSHPTQNNPREASVRHRNIPTDSTTRSSNIQRLRHDDDDENATWNGNSTQQM